MNILLKIFKTPQRISRISSLFYRYFSNDLETITKSTQLNKIIQNRLNNFRATVDLGKGPITEEDHDILEESIIKASTIDQIKILINYNFRNFEARHVAQMFKSIDCIIKYSNDEDSLKLELLGSKEFEILINRSFRVIRHFEADEALNTLILVNNLGISPDTILCQSLMKMVCHWINDYSINDLYTLTNYLKYYDKNPSKYTLLKALKLSVSLAIKHRIQYKEVDFDDPRILLKCIEIISFYGLDTYGDLDTVIKCLNQINKKLDKLNLKECLKLLSCIYELNITDEQCLSTVKHVKQNCIENIIYTDKTSLNELPAKFYLNALLKMQMNSIYYSKDLLDIIAEQTNTRKNDFGLFNLYLVLMKCWHLKYINYKLLNLFAKMIETNDENLYQSSVPILKLFQFFTLPSNSEEIHEDFSKLVPNIIATPKFKNETSTLKMNFFYLLSNCLILNAKLDENDIVRWFKEYLSTSLNICQTTGKRLIFLETMCIINQGLFVNKTISLNESNANFIQNKLQPFVTEYKIWIQNEKTEQNHFLLNQIYSIVCKNFSNEKILKNHITESGLVIDLMINFEKSPLGILLLMNKNYCRNPRIITGATKFYIDTLKNCNICPVLIDANLFNRLTELEKEIYVNREIEESMKN